MDEYDRLQHLLPHEIAYKIASSLQASDLCALGSCSRFWRELCGLDSFWISLYRDKWPVPDDFSDVNNQEKWKSLYVEKYKEVVKGCADVINFVQYAESYEARDFLKLIQGLQSTHPGFKDVQRFLFDPKHSVLINLVGVYYCIKCLEVSDEYLIEALEACKISERKICVKWWTMGRMYYGVRHRDDLHSCTVLLRDLPMEHGVLSVLARGAVHEVLRVKISVAYPPATPWSVQTSTPT